MNTTLQQKANSLYDRFAELEGNKKLLDAQLLATQSSMDEILAEQNMLERATLAIRQCRPILSQSPIKQCIELANTAIQAIFEFDSVLDYDIEDNCFVLKQADGTNQTILNEAEGGGLVAVISFVFNVYLLVKLEKRRVLFYDEAFTQISDEYFYKFIDFVRQLAKDLNFKIFMITHDARLTNDIADHVYFVQDGVAKQVK